MSELQCRKGGYGKWLTLVTGKMMKWVCLAQKIVDNGSVWRLVTRWVVQGYVLGPGMYKISMRDLEEATEGTCLGEAWSSLVLPYDWAFSGQVPPQVPASLHCPMISMNFTLTKNFMSNRKKGGKQELGNMEIYLLFALILLITHYKPEELQIQTSL